MTFSPLHFLLPVLLLSIPIGSAAAQNRGGTFSPQAAAGAQAMRAGLNIGLSVLRLTPAVQDRLKLTEEQRTGLGKIGMQMTREMRQVINRGRGGDVRDAITDVARKYESEGTRLLDQGQRTEFTRMRSEAAAYQGLGKSAVALLAVDGVTPAQRSSLTALARRQATRRKSILRPAGSSADITLIREAVEKHEAETIAEVRKRLTASQAAQFTQALGQGPARVTPGRK